MKYIHNYGGETTWKSQLEDVENKWPTLCM
jgi:hypothetical protein